MEGTSDPAELLALYKKRAVPVEKARNTLPADLKGRIVVGRLHHSKEKKELAQAIYESFPAQEAKD
jgi:hypothetical protein